MTKITAEELIEQAWLARHCAESLALEALRRGADPERVSFALFITADELGGLVRANRNIAYEDARAEDTVRQNIAATRA